MSHHHQLSPMLTSPYLCAKPRISSVNCSVGKNLQVLFDQSSTLPAIKRSAHPDLQRIASQTVRSFVSSSMVDLDCSKFVALFSAGKSIR